MSFFRNLFHKTYKESVVFIDISAGSVAGAYVRYVENETPSVLYTRRLSIEIHEGEPHEQAMLRALKTLGDQLIKEGAPALARATGSGKSDTVLVSVDAPWQETSIRTEFLEQKVPFIFTRSLVAEALKRTHVPVPGKLLADESIIGTILNGYETRNPYGKKVHRAAIIILTSLIDERIAGGIAATLRSLYHTKRILLIVGSSLRYQAMRSAFPHERNMLIIDAMGPSTSIALVRKNLFVASAEVLESDSDSHAWVGEVVNTFADIAKTFPLPRMIFLLAQESRTASLQETLKSANLGSLWLSDNPPKIVTILVSHIIGLVRQVATTPPDLALLLMTLYWQYGDSGEDT